VLGALVAGWQVEGDVIEILANHFLLHLFSSLLIESKVKLPSILYSNVILDKIWLRKVATLVR
jgi:hypothetical protein